MWVLVIVAREDSVLSWTVMSWSDMGVTFVEFITSGG